MGGATAAVRRKAIRGLVTLVAVMCVFIFVPAGTLRFLQGWIVLVLFAGWSLAVTMYLAVHDPALLERRTQAGPSAEKERTQQLIQSVASLAFAASIVVPGLDHRLGWSHAPWVAVIAGDALVSLGFFVVFLVFRENTFTSSVIEVAAEQRVIETGPYAVVRHPMYVGGLVLVAGLPLGLGSVAGLWSLPPFVAVIVWRLLDEERFLEGHLAGYRAYEEKVRYRLVPGLF